MGRILMTVGLITACAAAQQVRTIGRGCCSAATPPTLQVHLGNGSLQASGTGAPADSGGGLLVSPPPTVPTGLGNGEWLFLDPQAILATAPIRVGDGGEWLVSVALPPELSIGELAIQAVFIDQAMSVGFALSDAVQVTF